MSEGILLLLMLSYNFELVLSDGLVYRTKIPESFKVSGNISDVDKKTPNFIEANGYIAETHEITTADKYILGLHRIPKGKNEDEEKKVRPVVVMQHGLFSSSETWILSGPKSFPYIMADAGYDVWLPNVRGNLHSYRHVTLSDSSSQYWDFGIHETAVYDLAAIIDYVLQKTQQEQIFYVGYSRGTTIAYILLADKPEYNKKIKFMVSLAPVAYLRYTRSPLIRLLTDMVTTQHYSMLSWFVAITGIGPIQMGLVNNKIVPTLCEISSVTELICLHFLSIINGYSFDNVDRERLPLYFHHYPKNASEREVLHYLQIAREDQFENYDFGRFQNLMHYGTFSPPMYDLSKITIPIVFYYGSTDYFISLEDLNHLVSQIKVNEGVFKIPSETFNHLDYLWGKNAAQVLYEPALKLINEHRDEIEMCENIKPKNEPLDHEAMINPDYILNDDEGGYEPDDQPKYEQAVELNDEDDNKFNS